MIITETVTINGKQFIRTYSNTGVMIERGGVRYAEAIDPHDSGRVYTETEEFVEFEDAEEEDYRAALLKLGIREEDA